MTTTPLFGQPTPDENLSIGWNVQGNGAAQSTTGEPGQGYSEAGVTGDIAVAGQVSAGGNSMNGSTGPYVTDVLENGSYSASQAGVTETGVNPTSVGAVLTTSAALSGVVLSGMSLVVQNLNSATVTYKIGGEATAIAVSAAGAIIPAGAAITASASGVVFVTVGA